MQSLGILGIFAALVFPGLTQQTSVPVPVVNGSVLIQSIIGNESLDDVKIPIGNSTTFEAWYFDALAPDLSASIILAVISTDEQMAVTLDISHQDGSRSRVEIPTSSLNVSAIGKGSAAEADDNSWGWTSTSSLSGYTLHFDRPDQGLYGDITMESLGPSHVQCSESLPGAAYEFFPGLNWINNIPDAKSTVNLTINGTSIAFTGNSYEDKLWGVITAIGGVNQWYWGRGKAGNYSVVWYYVLFPDGTTVTSAYILKDSKVVYAGCDDKIVVRPYGEGITYPISGSFDGLEGYTINIDAGSIGKFAFTSQRVHAVGGTTDMYHRWIGNLTGGIIGGTNATGPSLWEFVTSS
ncbi:hypothetical protein B0O99DRAFT_696652 [Bisporella sp. PMI_857]|nr:hypothetical protein B0O99DRAFT_696652 [Bisporella sp. PMI_857]